MQPRTEASGGTGLLLCLPHGSSPSGAPGTEAAGGGPALFSRREGISPKGPATPAPAWTHRLTAHWLHTAAGQGTLNSTRPRAPLDARHCPGAGFSPRTPGLPAAAAGNAPAGPHVCFQSHRVTPSVPHRRPRCSEQGRLLIKGDWAMWPERAPRPDPWGIGADGVLGIR